MDSAIKKRMNNNKESSLKSHKEFAIFLLLLYSFFHGLTTIVLYYISWTAFLFCNQQQRQSTHTSWNQMIVMVRCCFKTYEKCENRLKSTRTLQTEEEKNSENNQTTTKINFNKITIHTFVWWERETWALAYKRAQFQFISKTATKTKWKKNEREVNMVRLRVLHTKWKQKEVSESLCVFIYINTLMIYNSCIKWPISFFEEEARMQFLCRWMLFVVHFAYGCYFSI